MRPLVRTCLLAALVLLVVAGGAPKNWSRVFATWTVREADHNVLFVGFFALPPTLEKAREEGWEALREEATVTVWGYAGDHRVAVLYDNRGSIAGVQLTFPEEDMVNTAYNWSSESSFIVDEIFGKRVVGGRFYLVPQETLLAGGRHAVGAEVAQALWMADGPRLAYVPRDASELPALGWAPVGCMYAFGRHYFYNVERDTDCQIFSPFFLIADPGDNMLFGVGFHAYGKLPTLKRNGSTRMPSKVYAVVAPDDPSPCLPQWTEEYGTMSVYVVFGDRPPDLNLWC